jgi:hypothetical protein
VHKLRVVIAVIGTALAFAVSFVMLAEVIGIASPWLALLLMFYFTGLAKIAEPLFVLRMPTSLGKVRRWEHAGVFYRKLGVFMFGRLLRNTPLRFLNTSVYLSSEAKDLRNLYRQGASAEAIHFWAALLFMPYIGYLLVSGRAYLATCFMAVQVIFNLYPILHLRMLRGRLDSILQRQLTHFDRDDASSVEDV